MKDPFENLSTEEKEILYRAPALVSVLASCSFDKIVAVRKADAIRLAHLKTFTADPALLFYYHKAEHSFEENFDAIATEYAPFSDEKRHLLQQEIKKINVIIEKLEPAFASLLWRSLQKYANHVRKADHSVFQDFIFPLPIPGLSC